MKKFLQAARALVMKAVAGNPRASLSPLLGPPRFPLLWRVFDFAPLL